MLPETQLLKTTEAAVVAGVDVHNVNKLIDDDILPNELFVLGNGRRVWPGGCAAVSFYFRAAGILDAHERRRTIRFLTPRLRDLDLWTSHFASQLKEDWTVHNRFVTIDFAAILSDTAKRLDKLTAAREAVVADPAILSATPVIKGTRVPVYAVAAKVAAGTPVEQILEDYPSIDKKKIELAAIYAKANPPRGRPSDRLRLPQGATPSSRHSFPRRKAV
jgi:uncharacterized protein (DUF433 family)